jgi:DNA-binding CsgD family transcriptional regulator
MTEDRLKDILDRLPKRKAEEVPLKTDRKTLKRLYVGRGLSIREIASRLGLHPHTVHYHLRRYGIETRTGAKRSALRKVKLETLEEGVKEKGVRGYARELGVHENTLRRYLREVKSPK